MRAGILRESPHVLITCCLRLRGGESKRCGNVFTYQEPAWGWGSWHFWTSSYKGLLSHRDANNLSEHWKKMPPPNSSLRGVLMRFTSATGA